MRQPPYHLRPNKAVDRLLLIEAIRQLERLGHDLSEYTYYGFGGSYLEEFRLLYELCPRITMVSIESDEQVYRRQRFHLPCGSLELRNLDFRSFLANYQAKNRRSVFWLDYQGLDYSNFEDLAALANKVSNGSIVKISLRADPRDFQKKDDDFRARFEAVMPAQTVPFLAPDKFADYVQGMVRVATQKALPYAAGRAYQLISSFQYSDATRMVTLTGVVCGNESVATYRDLYASWEFANLDWRSPKLIDLPVLSTKERLLLAGHLPSGGNIGQQLVDALGYFVDDDRRRSVAKMKQYAEFHRYFPYFVRAAP